MKRQLLLLLFILSGLNVIAQKDFEKGFYIDSNNNKVECFIKNQDWMGIPSKIDYMISENGQSETIDFSKMNAFQIYNSSHYYIKTEVDVDRDTDVADFKPKKVVTVLKVLIDGVASLYSSSEIFFYKINDGAIKQLVYKKYVDENSRIKQDNAYQKELYENLKCENNIVEIRKLRYKYKELTAFFKNYNECKSYNYTSFSKSQTKLIYNFNVIAGASSSNASFEVNQKFSVASSGTDELAITKDAETDNSSTSFIIGFEAEVLLPFNKNKWAVFVAPNFQQNDFLMSSIYSESFPVKLFAETSYSYIDIPFGIRHYMNLNEKSKLYLEGAFSFILLMDVKETTYFGENFGITTIAKTDYNYENISTAVRVGFGYNYNRKYSLSLNYYPQKDLSTSKVTGFSLIASYTLF